MSGASKPSLLVPVPTTFKHTSWGIEPIVALADTSDGRTHALHLRIAKIRWILAAVTAVGSAIIAISFSLLLPSTFTSSQTFSALIVLGLVIVMAIISISTTMACINALRVVRRSRVRCVLIGRRCMHVANERVDSEVDHIQVITEQMGYARVTQWQLVLHDGRRLLLHQWSTTSIALESSALGQFADAAGLAIRR